MFASSVTPIQQRHGAGIVALGLPLVGWLKNDLFYNAITELKKEKRVQTTNTSSSQHSGERTQDTPLSFILANISKDFYFSCIKAHGKQSILKHYLWVWFFFWGGLRFCFFFFF